MSKKYTIEYVKNEFEKRNYNLISTEYKNNSTKLEYVCDKGHKTFITFKDFLNGHGCSFCRFENNSKRRKYTLQFVKEQIEKSGYKLISTEYKNSSSYLETICPNNHKYLVKWNVWQQGSRCPICSGCKKLDIEFIKEKFNRIGYTLLTKKYINNKTNLYYICDKGHKETIRWDSFQRGVRCNICSNVKLGENSRHSYKFVKSEFEKVGYTLLSTEYVTAHNKLNFICDKGHINYTTWNRFQQGQRCSKCSNNHSKAELEIYELIKSYFPNTQNGNRSLIAPFELDIVIPEKKLAIEYCGLYWHSELSGKDKNYHLNKLQKCNEIGYRLITIFEDEYLFKKDIVINRLKHILNLSEAKVIHARKCKIKEIDATIKDEFINKFHIQGSDRSIIKLGAYYQDKLVSVMTFGKGNIAKGAKYEDNVYELNRFCLDYNYKVSGIANRFISYFKNKYEFNEIYTYSDKRWSDGDLYQKLGFEYLHDSVPNYWYIIDNNRIHRYNFRKSELNKKLENFNPELSEWNNMVKNGFDRIWDCGNVKWRLK